MADDALADRTGFLPEDVLIHLERVRIFDGQALIPDPEQSYFLSSALPGLTREIAEDSVYAYAEDVLAMRIVTFNPTISMDHVTAHDRVRMDLLGFDLSACAELQVWESSRHMEHEGPKPLCKGVQKCGIRWR